jgi:hypothetical protein
MLRHAPSLHLRGPAAALLAFTLALLACALALLAVPAASHAAQPGVVVHGAVDNAAISRIQQSGARHVRAFASWRMLEQHPGALTPHIVAAYDDMVNKLRALGIPTYLVVTESPSWVGAGNTPPPVGAYADFLRRLVSHFRGRVLGYEVWNEPEEPHFWAGGATAPAYTALLRTAYAAGKAADPGAKIGIGGLLANDYNFLQQLYQNGAGDSFDFVGLHTDWACNRTDPRQATRDVDGRVARFSFTGYREVRQTMVDHGDTRPIWMTELGWSTTTARCPSNPSQPAGVTAATQATYLTNAFACLAADPYVEMGSWFSLGDFGPSDMVGFRYGLFDWNGFARPALSAFQRAGSVAPDRSCGLGVDRGGPGLQLVRPFSGQNVSGDLVFRVTTGDPEGIGRVSLRVDGREIRVTRRTLLTGKWIGWRQLPYGPHTVSVRAVDGARNVSETSATVNRVPYGLGEPIRTTISVGLYGSGKKRLVGARLFTLPRVARNFVRGRLRVRFERKAGRRWVPFGASAGGSVSRPLRTVRSFRPGRYRVVVEFPGYKSFRPTTARRPFTVR